MAQVRVDNPETRVVRSLDWFVEKVKVWQDRFGLNAWTIHVKVWERPPSGIEGNTQTFPTVTEANIAFKGTQYEAWGDHVVVHELMHVVTDEWSTAVDHVIKTMVPSKLQKEAKDYLRPHEEQVVDNIAKAFQRLVSE